MQKPFVFMLAVLGALLPGPAFADENNLSVLPDIPMMPGMTEDPPQEQQRFMQQTTATVTGNQQMVFSFYNQHLRRDGWESSDPSHVFWARNGVQLVLGVDDSAGNGQTIVTFTETGNTERQEQPNDQQPEPGSTPGQ